MLILMDCFNKYILWENWLFLLEQNDQNLLHPMLDLQIVLFKLICKEWTPILQDHINRLHEMCQIHSKQSLREINEFHSSWANPKKLFPQHSSQNIILFWSRIPRSIALEKCNERVLVLWIWAYILLYQFPLLEKLALALRL